MKYPEIPEEVNVSKVMYGVNVLIASSLVAAILVFLNGSALEDRIFGLLLFIPPIAANSLAIANPEAFHYMWYGLYDIQKVISIFFFIPAIVLSLQLQKGQTMNHYYFVFLIIVIIYLVPQVIVPLSVHGINNLWTYSTVIFRIPQEPGYIWKDIVFPGSVIGFILLFLGYGFKGIIQ